MARAIRFNVRCRPRVAALLVLGVALVAVNASVRSADAVNRKDAAKTPAKKTPAKGAPKKSDSNPFAGFPTSIGLHPPADQDAKSMSIGKLNVDPAALCLIYLRGGDDALIGRGSKLRFVLEEAEQDGGASRWIISVASGPASGPTTSTAIAEVVRRDNLLRLDWLPAAATQADAGQLANCLLELAAGQGKHVVALRKPVLGAPIAFQFDEPMMGRWDVDSSPDPGRIKVELKLGSREPRYRFVGSSTIDAARGSTWIEFMDRRSTEALKLKVESQFKKGLQLTVTPFFQSPGESQLVRLTPAAYKRAVDRARLLGQQLEVQLASLPKGGSGGGKKGGKGKSGPPSGVAQLRDQLEKQLAVARAAQTQLADLADIQKALDGQGKLWIRATMDVDGHSVELVKAEGGRNKP